MVQDRRSAENGEIGAMFEDPSTILRAGQFAGDTQARFSARQVGEPVDQGLTGELGFDGFLEDVPQRHVQIV